MKNIGLDGQVSGSGSSLFALCTNRQNALMNIRKLKEVALLQGITFKVAYFKN